MGLFKRSSSRGPEAEAAGSALSLWDLEPASVRRGGAELGPARPAQAKAAPRERGRRPLGEEVAGTIQEIGGAPGAALEHSAQALDNARRALESMESHAGAAEARATRADRLAKEVSRYHQQEAAFQALIEKIKAAERRAIAADARARTAMESITRRNPHLDQPAVQDRSTESSARARRGA